MKRELKNGSWPSAFLTYKITKFFRSISKYFLFFVTLRQLEFPEGYGFRI